MAVQLPPIPNNPVTDTFVWRDWFYKVSQLLVQQASIAWTSIDFTGSNIQDIQNRQHNALQAIQGGIASQYYHLTSSEYTRLQANQHNTLSGLQGGTTNEYYHLTAAQLAAVLAAYAPQYGAFHFDFSTTLTSAISSGATTIPVVTTSGFSSTGAIIIEKEMITYTGITGTSFTGCTRGAYGSTAASHVISSYVNGAQGTTAATATLLQINTTDLSNGVSLNTSTSEVTVANNGTYNLQFSVQTFNFGNNTDNFTIWFRKNGSDIANTASIQTTPAIHAGTPGSAIVTVNIFDTLVAGDKIQLYWATDSGDTVVVTANPGTSPTHPASPGVIFTVNQVGA